MGQKIRLFAFTVIIIFCIFITGCISGQSPGGTLQLSSVPVGAGVYLDNQYRGSTPCTITDVSAGNHTVEFRADGYQSWSVAITVSPQTYQLSAQLVPLSQPGVQPTSLAATPVPITINPANVTIQSDRSTMNIGTTMTFSGTSTGNGNVILVLYGPGAYTSGVTIAQPPVNSFGAWTYTWNPGYRIIGGTYTMVVYDPLNTTSANTGFTVLGSSTPVGSRGSANPASSITISESRNVISAFGSITFTGFCPTGSTNVILTLYGPGQYTNGIVVSTPSVNANQIWSYTWTAPGSITAAQTGVFTMTVQDAERTQSASVQFTLNS